MPEQLPVDPTIWWTGETNSKTGRKVCRFKKVLPNGKPRLRHPETNKPLVTNGDIIVGKKDNPLGCLKLQWNGKWIPIPTVDEFMEWTVDSVCPTPDGDIVEPDAPNSWLSLVGLV